MLARKRELKFEKSFLLTTEENAQIKAIIGERKESLATTVVQIYTSQYGQWQKVDTGILCFIKDHREKAYFFRLCCLERRTVIWEEEIYLDFVYVCENDFFHTFEGKECVVGLNFANTLEAGVYKKAVHSIFLHGEVDIPEAEKLLTIKNGTEKHQKKSKKEKTRRKTLVISEPMNFQHVAHVGFGKGLNSMEGFNNTKNDDDVLEIFKRAGVSENQLNDRKTREFMVNFVKRSASTRKSQKRRAPPPPSIEIVGAVQHQTSFYPNPLSPPLPPRPMTMTQTDGIMRYKRTSFAPQLKALKPPRPPTQKSFISPLPPRPPTQKSFISPPPPPPPMLSANQFIPPPPPPQLTPPPLKFIQRPPTQVKLPMVESTDGRSALLDSIRKGRQLKPVNDREMQPLDDEEEKNDIAAALSKAIAIRERAIQYYTSDSDTDYHDSDEWDDD